MRAVIEFATPAHASFTNDTPLSGGERERERERGGGGWERRRGYSILIFNGISNGDRKWDDALQRKSKLAKIINSFINAGNVQLPNSGDLSKVDISLHPEVINPLLLSGCVLYI